MSPVNKKVPILQVDLLHPHASKLFHDKIMFLLGLDISQLMISPKRKRTQGSNRTKDLIPFKAFRTYLTPKSPGDPWTLVESPNPVNLAVANWEAGVKHTGWLGEGSLQRAIYVSCYSSMIEFVSLQLKGGNYQWRVCNYSAQIRWCKSTRCRKSSTFHTSASWFGNRMG